MRRRRMTLTPSRPGGSQAKPGEGGGTCEEYCAELVAGELRSLFTVEIESSVADPDPALDWHHFFEKIPSTVVAFGRLL